MSPRTGVCLSPRRPAVLEVATSLMRARSGQTKREKDTYMYTYQDRKGEQESKVGERVLLITFSSVAIVAGMLAYECTYCAFVHVVIVVVGSRERSSFSLLALCSLFQATATRIAIHK